MDELYQAVKDFDLGYVSRRHPLTGTVPTPKQVRFAVEDPLLQHFLPRTSRDRLDDPSGLRDRADESGRIEAKHRLAGERSSQGACRSMDRVAFGHRTSMVRHTPGWPA